MNDASAPERNWTDEIRPAIRDAATSGIVEVFNYGRGRQGLIPLWVGEGDLPTPAFIAPLSVMPGILPRAACPVLSPYLI